MINRFPPTFISCSCLPKHLFILHIPALEQSDWSRRHTISPSCDWTWLGSVTDGWHHPWLWFRFSWSSSPRGSPALFNFIVHLSAQLQDSPPRSPLFSWFDFCTNRPYKSLKSSVFRCVHVWSAGVRSVPAAARWGTKQLLALTFPSTDTHPWPGVCFVSALSFMCCCFNGRSASRYHRDKLEKHLISCPIFLQLSAAVLLFSSSFFFCSTYFHHLLFPPSDWVCVWVFACKCVCVCCVCGALKKLAHPTISSSRVHFPFVGMSEMNISGWNGAERCILTQTRFVHFFSRLQSELRPRRETESFVSLVTSECLWRDFYRWVLQCHSDIRVCL